MRAYRQACIQQEHAAVGPGCQQPAVVGGRFEGRVVPLQGFEDVLEGGWGRGGRAHGEAHAVGLVDVVVGVLADDDGFDGV